MNLKKLLLLSALLGILIVIAVVQKRPPGPANLADEAGMTALPTTALAADDIQGIDIGYGSQLQNTLQLRRHHSGWVVANYYQAPVQTAKVNTLLRVLTHLQGELRADKAELLNTFQLESGQAYHLRLFTRAQDQSAVHLLIGKRNSTIGFVRLEDDTRVYSISADLFSVLDLQPDQAGGAPDRKAWLDLQIQHIAEQAIETVTLRSPQRTWQFSRSLPAAASRADSTSSKPEHPKWILNHPVVDVPLRQGYVDGLIATLRTLRAEDITASDPLQAHGLTHPAYQATVSWRTDADGQQSSTLYIGHEVPQQKDKRYARRGHSGPVYILPAWAFKRLFPQPDQFLDLPGLDTQPDALRRITLSSAGRTVRFEREQQPAPQDDLATPPSNWRLTHPAAAFQIQKDRFDQWVKHLASFSLHNLAPASFKSDTSQQAVELTIDAVLENGTHHTLRLGPVIDDLPQYQALFFNTFSTPFAITHATRQRIFPGLKDLLIIRPLPTNPDDVTRLTWQLGPQRWRLERSKATLQADRPSQAGVWRLVDAERTDIDQRQAAAVLQQIIGITAEDWIETPEPAWHDAVQPLILSLGFPGNRMVRLTFMKRNTLTGLMSSDSPGLFIIPEVTYTSLQASLTALSTAPTSLSKPLTLQP